VAVIPSINAPQEHGTTTYSLVDPTCADYSISSTTIPPQTPDTTHTCKDVSLQPQPSSAAQ
jgi:hypothetical protein